MRRRVLAVLALVIAALAPASEGAPLTLEQIRRLILVPAPDATVAGEISTLGIAFEPSEATVTTLKKLGAGRETTAAVIGVRKVIDTAETELPALLNQLYTQLNQGSVRSLADLVEPSLLGNFAKLDTICQPGTYRAHLMDKVVSRPGGEFEVYVRLLRQPVSEQGRKLVFRALPTRLRLDDVDASEETLSTWFQPQLATAPELVRNFVWAARNGQPEPVAAILSPGMDAAALFRPPLTDAWSFETMKVERPEVVDLCGIKIKVDVSTNPYPYAKGSFLVEAEGASPRIVAWSWKTALQTQYVEGRDREMENRTLARFGLAASPTAAGGTGPGPSAKDVLLPRAIAALASHHYDQAKALFDDILSRSGSITLPVGREKNLGVDRWTLVLGDGKLVLKDAAGIKAEAVLQDVTVEGTGAAEAAESSIVRSFGSFVRLKIKGKAYTLYYLPQGARCREASRRLSLGYFPECGEEGQQQQAAVAEYLAEAIRAGAQPRNQ